MALGYVAEVACAQGGGLAYGDVYGELMPDAWRVAWVCEDCVVVAAALSDLVVALPELWGEHHAHDGHIDLIAQAETLMSYVEVVYGHGAEGDVDAEASLGRVVAIAVVVEYACVCSCHAASHET